MLNKLYAFGSIFRDNLPIEIQSSLLQSEFKFETMRLVNVFSPEISANSKELEMVNNDNMNKEEYEEEIPLILDLSDDEEYT